MRRQKNFNKLKNKSRNSILTSNQTGFSLIELLIVVVIIGIIAAIAIPSLLASRRAANESSAIASMRLIHTAQVTYLSSRIISSYGTLIELRDAGIIDAAIGTAPHIKARYNFGVNILPIVVDKPPRFEAHATPQVHILSQPLTASGTRDFGINETGVIYQTSDNTAVTFDANTRAVMNGVVVRQP